MENIFCMLRTLPKIDRSFQKTKIGKSAGVLICSDCTEILEEIKEQYPDYILPNGSVAQDMYALSLCDYILGPQATTMSAWAAYIGNAKLAQVTFETDSFDLSSFKNLSRLEPFSPFLAIENRFPYFNLPSTRRRDL